MSSTKGLVLVTGSNGFIGARTVEAFLNAGYSVRAVTRSQSSASGLLDALPQFSESGQLSISLVPDITIPGAFNEAVKGVTAIAHLASPVNFKITDADLIISSAVKGTTGILESALREPSLKYVTEEDWNDEAEDTLARLGDTATGHNLYVVSKIRAERAFWEFRNKNADKIKFSMTAINPIWVAGPPLILPEDPNKLSDTAIIAYQIMAGQSVPPAGPGNGTHVDVRDVARLITFAVDHPDVTDGQRYIAGGNGNFANVQAYSDVLRKVYPERRDIIVEGEPGKGYLEDYSEPPNSRKVDASKAVKTSGQGWIPFEKKLLDAAKAYERYF
ncbi:NADPH-dependent aldehyde reductase ARI1 [Colletotrichum aenigma]|uniref:NADPH-dependent aldehyde reductase ARI1 n=1 Tax=Colletotrichum aenigma TaxID=1215731 RepID=UPI0018723ED1|nr:NADPH-dependent aldehyde reductase ARI1 [Colletotrichum aenigma]KAF5524326.1 NADPH-dependent aldehyde reductase ARI1 [Colletotrichum aenigma]